VPSEIGDRMTGPVSAEMVPKTYGVPVAAPVAGADEPADDAPALDDPADEDADVAVVAAALDVEAPDAVEPLLLQPAVSRTAAVDIAPNARTRPLAIERARIENPWWLIIEQTQCLPWSASKGLPRYDPRYTGP
jgi:hypothetical protein